MLYYFTGKEVIVLISVGKEIRDKVLGLGRYEHWGQGNFREFFIRQNFEPLLFKNLTSITVQKFLEI